MTDPDQQRDQNTELTRRLNNLDDHLDALFTADLNDPQRTEAFLTELARRTSDTPNPSTTDSPTTQPTLWGTSRNVLVNTCVDTATERTAESLPAAKPAALAITTAERATEPTPAAAKTEVRIRMGFMLDIAGYGSRTTRARARVQERLTALIRQVLDDLNVRSLATDRQGTGDGMLLFLPSELDVQHALPVLLHSTATHLAVDNEEFQDRLRLRMAVDIGPVRLTPLGFGGATATNLGRMLDSNPLRDWLVDHPNHDLALVVSDRLHSFAIAEDVPAVLSQFKRVSIEIKEFASIAWLWTRTRHPTDRHTETRPS